MPDRPEKYSALRKHLQKKAKEFRESGESQLTITFKEIEALGVRLPPSAYKYHAWWSNSNYGRPWTQARFQPKAVDLENEKLIFLYSGSFSPECNARQRAKRLKELEERGAHPVAIFERSRRKEIDQIRRDLNVSAGAISPPSMADVVRPYSGAEKAPPGTPPPCRHPLYGALKGYIRIMPGVDLTKPADPEWGERVWGEDEM